MDLLRVLAIAVAVLALLVWILWAWVRSLQRRLGEARHRLQSQATRHGQSVEQFVPFLAEWPWEPSGFRFLGAPIDGIQFADDEVVFVEVKTGGSRLSPTQQNIKALVEAGKVRWREVRL